MPAYVLNNAAITGELLLGAGADFPDLARTSLDDWNRALHTSLTGAFLVARQMDREIVGRYPATLINVASMYALNGPHHRIYEGMPFGSFPAYSASKAGIHGLTLWLAGYWAGRQATVNTLAPGAVFNDHFEEFQRRVGELIMAGRMANREEIAHVMLFPCSTQGGYTTGQLATWMEDSAPLGTSNQASETISRVNHELGSHHDHLLDATGTASRASNRRNIPIPVISSISRHICRYIRYLFRTLYHRVCQG